MLNVPPTEETRGRRGPEEPEQEPRSSRTRKFDRGLKSALIACLVALAIHLIPLLLPRNVPEQELAIARAMPNATNRAQVLKPLKDNPKSTGAHLRTAAELLMEGSPLDAYELAKEAEKKEPGEVETQLLLARICHGQRMNRCEEESLARAVELAPGDPRADLLRADFQERDGDKGGALASVGKAYGKAPGNVGVGVRYARLLSAMGQGEEALQVLRQLEKGMGKPQLLMEEGLVRMAQGRMKEARELFASAVDADPKLVMGYYHLGMAAFREGDVEGAEEALRQADRLDMSDMRPLSALCDIQRKTGRTEQLTATRMDLERRFPERMEAVRSACRTLLCKPPLPVGEGWGEGHPELTPTLGCRGSAGATERRTSPHCRRNHRRFRSERRPGGKEQPPHPGPARTAALREPSERESA